MHVLLFHFWGRFDFCIIIQVLSSFLLSISPIFHLFTLTAFEVPINISHLDCCDSPWYQVSLPLFSPFFQTILHAGWSNGQIWLCHSLFCILQCLMAYRKKSRFLSPAYKALHSLISFSLSDFIFYHCSYTDEIPDIWNHMWFPIIACFITLPCFCAYCFFSIQCLSLPSLFFSWWNPVSPSSLLSCHILCESFLDFIRLNYKLSSGFL